MVQRAVPVHIYLARHHGILDDSHGIFVAVLQQVVEFRADTISGHTRPCDRRLVGIISKDHCEVDLTTALA